MSKVRVIALDSVSDSRLGNLVAGQEGVCSADAGKELESLGFVKVLGEEKTPKTKEILSSNQKATGPAENKAIKAPANKTKVKTTTAKDLA